MISVQSLGFTGKLSSKKVGPFTQNNAIHTHVPFHTNPVRPCLPAPPRTTREGGHICFSVSPSECPHSGLGAGRPFPPKHAGASPSRQTAADGRETHFQEPVSRLQLRQQQARRARLATQPPGTPFTPRKSTERNHFKKSGAQGGQLGPSSRPWEELGFEPTPRRLGAPGSPAA